MNYSWIHTPSSSSLFTHKRIIYTLLKQLDVSKVENIILKSCSILVFANSRYLNLSVLERTNGWNLKKQTKTKKSKTVKHDIFVRTLSTMSTICTLILILLERIRKAYKHAPFLNVAHHDSNWRDSWNKPIRLLTCDLLCLQFVLFSYHSLASISSFPLVFTILSILSHFSYSIILLPFIYFFISAFYNI